MRMLTLVTARNVMILVLSVMDRCLQIVLPVRLMIITSILDVTLVTTNVCNAMEVTIISASNVTKASTFSKVLLALLDVLMANSPIRTSRYVKTVLMGVPAVDRLSYVPSVIEDIKLVLMEPNVRHVKITASTVRIISVCSVILIGMLMQMEHV